jgi:hypothetical protein
VPDPDGRLTGVDVLEREAVEERHALRHSRFTDS